MAPVKLELVGLEVTLTLTVDDAGWCTVSALLGTERHELGADQFLVIRERLLGALADVSPIADRGTIAGMPVRCALMLYEKHSSIYVAREGEMLHWFFQGPDGRLLSRAMLHARECVAWREKLAESQAS